ncbi:MAG: AMP-binding protein [Leptospirales bacterium]|nr:AMP-binding protein [Leptospirales bacterium]
MQFPWLANYDPGVLHHLDYPLKSLHEVFQESAQAYADNTCISFFGSHITYAQVEKDSNDLAHRLVAAGVKPGDRVLLLLPNSPQFVISYYAVLRCGAVVVPANPLDTAQQIQYKIKDSECSAAIYLDILFKNISPSLELLSTSISCDFRDYLSFFQRFVLGLKMRFMKHPMPGSRSLDFRRLLAQENSPPGFTVSRSTEDLAAIVYTSGTTGIPKGVMLSHKALVTNMIQYKAWAQVASTDVSLCALPFFQGSGMSLGLNATFTSGGCMVLMPRWEVGHAIEHLRKGGVTLFAGVPNMYEAMVHHPDFGKLTRTKLRGCFVGTATLSEDLKQSFHSKTGAAIVEGYGLTETVSAKSSSPYQGLKKLKSIGIPWPDTQFRIVDEKGQDVSAGQSGEIIIRSPDIMMGYWKNEAATKEAVRDGWLYTGDIGYMDEDGYFCIVKRKKEPVQGKYA